MAASHATKKENWYKTVKVMDAKKATLAIRPQYNAYVCGNGLMKSKWEKVLRQQKKEFNREKHSYLGK